MEMAEEGINQHPKRIKVEEIDRISALPDSLLHEILGRLPSTKTAIKTTMLSKRWKYLWTSVPSLVFQNVRPLRPFSDFASIVDETLDRRLPLKLSKFAIHTSGIDFTPLESQVYSWIRYAMRHKVEELHLKLSYLCFKLSEDFFKSSSFTHLNLTACIFNPQGAISWGSLRNLVIGGVKLKEDLMENIFTGSPVLETLELDYCYGYSRLDITSNSVKNMVIHGYIVPIDEELDFYDAIEINAPNILSITIEHRLWLREVLLLNVSSLVKANINFRIEGYDINSGEVEKVEKDTYRDFIRKLHKVKELKIQGRLFKGADKEKVLKKYGLDGGARVHVVRFVMNWKGISSSCWFNA